MARGLHVKCSHFLGSELETLRENLLKYFIHIQLTIAHVARELCNGS